MKRIIIGISGATGAIYGVRMLRMLAPIKDVETHLVISPAGLMNIQHELDMDKKSVCALADETHTHLQIGANIASGSFKTCGMVIAPCSVKTLAAIANGFCDNLLSRAADVCLKERRRLVLMVRETPLHLGHIRNMAALTEMGGIIYPPLPSFYAKPASIEDMVDQTIAKVLDGFDIDVSKHLTPWPGIGHEPN
ncbi:MAG: 3-octaprenyl-4-hydroxybenzoate carboxy-lyase [Robiginitomaculum sp.]|nr:MAG: 3-octaprenyl-4-hydroxybenzoate carboxy-lyase [Robiginitomaculum sp.]